jgi:hypothetical protein
MLETLIEFSEATPVKIIASQIILWTAAVIYTYYRTKKIKIK